MYAWVEWMGGEDVGKHSVIPLNHIRGFVEEEWERSKDNAYIVEWREGKIPPKGGWKMFSARVHDVAGELCLFQ